MKEIAALTTEDGYVRKALRECENTYFHLQDLTMHSSKPEIREWASKALDAINNEVVHDLWSKVIPGAVDWHDMQELIDRRFTGDTGEFAVLVNSLSDSRSSYLANMYLEVATKKVVEDVAHEIHDFLRLRRQLDGTFRPSVTQMQMQMQTNLRCEICVASY